MKTLSLVLLLIALSPLAHARTLVEIKKSGELRAAVDAASPPFNYYKGTDLVGFEIDLANELAKHMGLRIKWTVQPFNSLLVALGQDRFDVIVTSHAITPKRMEVADFVAPHYCTGATLVSKPKGPKTAKDLVGKTVSVPVGTVYHEHLKTISGIKEIKTFPSETDALQAMLSDRTEAWVSDQFVALEAIKAHPDQHLDLGERMTNQSNAMVVAKGNHDLQDALNKELALLMKNGAYLKLSKKYFTRDIRCQ